jgi:hypothetical protein
MSYQSIFRLSRCPPKVLCRQWVAIYKRTSNTGQFGDEVVAFGQDGDFGCDIMIISFCIANQLYCCDENGYWESHVDVDVVL